MVKLLFRQRSHLPARDSSTIPHGENPRKLRQGKTERNRRPHCAYTLHALRRKQPVAVRSANRGRKHADTLIMAQQIRANSRHLRKLAGAKQFFIHERSSDEQSINPGICSRVKHLFGRSGEALGGVIYWIFAMRRTAAP